MLMSIALQYFMTKRWGSNENICEVGEKISQISSPVITIHLVTERNCTKLLRENINM